MCLEAGVLVVVGAVLGAELGDSEIGWWWAFGVWVGEFSRLGRAPDFAFGFVGGNAWGVVCWGGAMELVEVAEAVGVERTVGATRVIQAVGSAREIGQWGSTRGEQKVHCCGWPACFAVDLPEANLRLDEPFRPTFATHNSELAFS